MSGSTQSIETHDENQQWVCMYCGYIYDPAEGDPAGGIPPGTAFEDLPDDWCCPNCSTEKDTFEPAS